MEGILGTSGGMIDEGETARECAVRELLEETNQMIEDLSFKGFDEI